MATRVQLPQTLRDYCREQAQIEIDATNVGEVLDGLKQRFPTLYRSICDETDRVRQHISFFVNQEWIPIQMANSRSRNITGDDVVTIWTAVSGG
ncbi:MAG: MoaD/ThiS family protein [Planctomycetales bacterium]|nr:MoaD/ThiS family protein [Planctomycetales bacterium]